MYRVCARGKYIYIAACVLFQRNNLFQCNVSIWVRDDDSANHKVEYVLYCEYIMVFMNMLKYHLHSLSSTEE